MKKKNTTGNRPRQLFSKVFYKKSVHPLDYGSNINLLTHLESDRVLWLKQNKDISTDFAKKQTSSEIMESFFGEHNE